MSDEPTGADVDAAIRQQISTALGTGWRITARHLRMSAWNDSDKRINALARMALRGWHLMYSQRADVEGTRVMWLHFASRRS